MPGALTDFFGEQNDTLNFSFRTKTFDDYGSARINVFNTKYPIIVQLTNESGDVKFSKYLTQSDPIDFNAIDAGVYYLRVIQDTNANGKWDSGHFINKKQPEKVSYFSDKLEVRAGWELFMILHFKIKRVSIFQKFEISPIVIKFCFF